MAITTADIKLMASARMTDEPDGGGRMSGNALQDGAENNIFPDLSSLNRAQGALQFRKTFPSVLNAGTDTLLGTHLVLDDVPDDADVFSILIPSSGDSQEQAALATALNSSGESYAYRGQTVLTATAAAAAQTLSVAGHRTPLIPKTVATGAESGDLAVEAVVPVQGAWESSGQTVSMVISGANLVPATPIGRAHLKPGSVTGTWAGGSVSSDKDGLVTFAGTGGSTYSQSAGATFYTLVSGPTPTGLSVTAEVMVEVKLPQQKLSFALVAGQTTYSLSIPAATALNSLYVRYPIQVNPGNGNPSYLTTESVYAFDGKETMVPVLRSGATPQLNYAALNRAAGVVALVFQSPLPGTSEIEVFFADGGQTIPIEVADLASGGAITAGAASATIDAGYLFGGAAFSITGGESSLRALNGSITNISNVVRGAVSDSGAISIPGTAGTAIVNWYGVQRNASPSVTTFDGTLPTDLQPTTLTITGDLSASGTFTSTANAAGGFASGGVTGTYNSVTGALSLAFAAAVDLYSLAYSATRNLPLTSTADLQGLNESAFATDGTVPVIHVSDVVVLHHSANVAAATYANGNTVNCGRTDLASVRLIGNDGASILIGWTVNLAAGIVTVNDISGWSQPVVVRHTIEHMAVVSGLPTAQSVLLNRALTREFPSGSKLSSALVLGDLQALVSASFSQQTWTDVWSDSRIGNSIAAQYQQLTNPIVVTNNGAVNERWRVTFTSSTAFILVGETLGQISTGTVNSDLAPINPATSQPYFTLASVGWGGGWAAGNVLRFNTRGANYSMWVARTVRPSAPNDNPDSLTVAIRGDIDA